MQPNYTLSQFQQIDKNEQIEILEQHATCLDLARFSSGHKIGLFDLCGFYVEVWVQSRTGQITQITPFQGGKRLDYYLSMISLQPFLSCL